MSETNQLFRLARESRGLSQSKFAVLIGSSQPSVARIESGGNLTLKTMNKMADALGFELSIRLKEK